MQDFTHGPFSIESSIFQHDNRGFEKWSLTYKGKTLAESDMPESATKSEIIETFSEARAEFIRRHRQKQESTPDPLSHGYTVRLVESTAVTGEKGRTLDKFWCLAPIEGLSSTLIDDRHKTWAVTDEIGTGLKAAVPMGKDEFERLKTAHQAIAEALTENRTEPKKAPPLAWVLDLLPEEITTENPSEWRAPTSWEIRHLVGEGSFSGLSGAKAAELVGVSPANFRKYTASDDAKNRQKISYAMWHLLLIKIGAKPQRIDKT